jgi:hypothetical protein
VRIDRTKPTAGAPKTSFRTSFSLAGMTMPVVVTWTASDVGGAGVASYDVARSLDGGAFSVIQTGLTSASLAQSASGGHSYRFEVRARDKAGNVGSWVAGPTLRPALVQQTAAGITWTGTWATVTATAYSGGSARTSATSGAGLTYTFTGRAIAILASRGPATGQFKVYVDGAYVVTAETMASSHLDRAVVFARTLAWGTHTIKLAVVGTAGRPSVTIDAFEVMR